ncbi:uncharacterized protein MELLADRAFT_101644 [Melampsora larici-populina 98AG31]|uniref:Uncharacterized protein n=1 Tax=Melampsora larici-populina (strain 98AG31 / pathotype 3-4-7) TaxID=747676 RepID=F4R6I1_MELLP|nr:uncharacterized protein MELLADRAFT_101644 [Melampsora larici-populina 98AG31]EGG11884.1 hypothetical protein MELLADRAFT_101644 [Melampsora larici-populina 98AG31]
MLRRSQSAANEALLNQSEDTRRLKSLTARPQFKSVYLNASEDTQAAAGRFAFQSKHAYPARPQQVDSLVLEKANVNISAINLTGPNCTADACEAILLGKYPFVYVCIKLTYLASHGYIPLDVEDLTATTECARQAAAGMPACDCSNCLPEAAEALWLAQLALTNANFDGTFSLSPGDLMDLVRELPMPPFVPPSDIRRVALRCSREDPIFQLPTLETLVADLTSAFKKMFDIAFPTGSDLGPEDYFGRELAWDIAKNIDILRVPQDLCVILGSESLTGQFDVIFKSFLKWQEESDSPSAITSAAERRRKACRTPATPKVHQSVEGATMAKERAETDKAELIRTRELAKEQNALQKAATRAKRAQDKRDADAQHRARKDASLAAKSRRSGVPPPQLVSPDSSISQHQGSTSSKRPVEDTSLAPKTTKRHQHEGLDRVGGPSRISDPQRI